MASAAVHRVLQEISQKKTLHLPKSTITYDPKFKRVNHPSTSQMVTKALTKSKSSSSTDASCSKTGRNRKGISLQAIKKYVVANYNVNLQNVNPFIKRYLKKAVSDGLLVQTKGRGANGSFKLVRGGTTKVTRNGVGKVHKKKSVKAKARIVKGRCSVCHSIKK